MHRDTRPTFGTRHPNPPTKAIAIFSPSVRRERSLQTVLTSFRINSHGVL